MLAKTNSKTSFDQFLFSHFDLKTKNESVMKTDSCGSDNKVIVRTKKKTTNPPKADQSETGKTKVLKTKAPILSKAEVESIVSKKRIGIATKEQSTSLTELIDSIPEQAKSLNIEELTHKHESEWYHTFRDLQEEIASDLSKKHPHYRGVLKLKSEIKEFWEQLDEHIEKAILELERIFQAFPTMSRVAVIYLLSAIIAVPLVFFSANQDEQVTYQDQVNDKLGSVNPEMIEFSKEMKSEYVAKNSAEILASGKTFIQVTEGLKPGRVAGVYADNSALIDNGLKRKISNYYSYLTGLKDEITYIIKNKLAN